MYVLTGDSFSVGETEKLRRKNPVRLVVSGKNQSNTHVYKKNSFLSQMHYIIKIQLI